MKSITSAQTIVNIIMFDSNVLFDISLTTIENDC